MAETFLISLRYRKLYFWLPADDIVNKRRMTFFFLIFLDYFEYVLKFIYSLEQPFVSVWPSASSHVCVGPFLFRFDDSPR